MTAPPPLFGPPLDASLDGHRVDDLMALATQLVAGFAVVIFAVLLVLLWRYRARPGHRAIFHRGDSRMHALGVAGLAVFVLVSIDFNLARIAHADLTGHIWNLPRGPAVLRVELMPQQFAWNVRYAGADGRFGTPDDAVTLNDLRVPVNTPVVVSLVARDVIHSFFAPAFRVKQDAIPGRVTRTWFQATRVGRYEIACAQLCGFAHYQMRAVLSVTSRAEYERWLARTASDSQRTYVPSDAAAHWGWDWRE